MLVVVTLATVFAVPPAQAEHAWEPLAPAPQATEGACTAAIGNRIYVAFGLSGGDSNLLRIYDIETNTWTMGDPAPTRGRSEFYRGVGHGGRLYCLGGRPNPESWIYDTETGAWAPGAPPPETIVGATAAVKGNSIYVFGGREGFAPCTGPAHNRVWRYDIDEDAWYAAGPLTLPRSDATAEVFQVGQKVYLFGGCDTPATYYEDVEIYDTVTETSAVVPLAYPGGPRADLAAAPAGPHTIRLTGGQRDGLLDPAQNHLIFDADKTTMTAGTPMPTNCPPGVGRGEHELVYHGGRLYAVVGACPGFGISQPNLDMLKLSP
jgi:N-acetylneuraminic acid mutarotase